MPNSRPTGDLEIALGSLRKRSIEVELESIINLSASAHAAAAARLPDHLWRYIFTFLQRPAPAHRALTRLDRNAWHQRSLTILMRVNSRFHEIAGPLLYHTCYVAAPHKFFYGLNSRIEPTPTPTTTLRDKAKRSSKLALLNHVKRLELIHADRPSEHGRVEDVADACGFETAAEVMEGPDNRYCAMANKLLLEFKKGIQNAPYQAKAAGEQSGQMSQENSTCTLMENLQIIRIGAYDEYLGEWDQHIDDLLYHRVDPLPWYRMPKNAFEVRLDPDNVETESEFEQRMKRRKKDRYVRMYDRQVALHPSKWGLIYPLLELIDPCLSAAIAPSARTPPASNHASNHASRVICQRICGGPMTLGSLPLPDIKKHFKNVDPERSIPLKVCLHIDMQSRESPLTPYCPIVPGATNYWFIEYHDEDCPSESSYYKREDLYHLRDFQASFIEFSESKLAQNINTTLTIYNLIPAQHAREMER
ncbi:hypothetical protein IAU59_005632 [Kwoniella sp. CBS 9459]